MSISKLLADLLADGATLDVDASGNVRIYGDLTVNGTFTTVDTNTNTTEQWLITNDGTGPAVIINQTGAQPIIDIQDDGTSSFYIENGGNVGIGNQPQTNQSINNSICQSQDYFQS